MYLTEIVFAQKLKILYIINVKSNLSIFFKEVNVACVHWGTVSLT